MRIDVKLYATLRKYAPEETELGESFPLDIETRTITTVLEILGIKASSAKIVMVNGNRIMDYEHELSEGDLLVIFPPIGGGA